VIPRVGAQTQTDEATARDGAIDRVPEDLHGHHDDAIIHWVPGDDDHLGHAKQAGDTAFFCRQFVRAAEDGGNDLPCDAIGDLLTTGSTSASSSSATSTNRMARFEPRAHNVYIVCDVERGNAPWARPFTQQPGCRDPWILAATPGPEPPPPMMLSGVIHAMGRHQAMG
jgi:hypothetical protein